MTRKAIMKAAHRQAKKAQYFKGGHYIVYLSFFMRKENWNLDMIKEESEEIQMFTLSITYKNKLARKHIKEMGGKWNPDTKVWTVNCKPCQLDYLEEYIYTNKSTPKEKGNYGTGCYTTYAKAMRYGYDAIER